MYIDEKNNLILFKINLFHPDKLAVHTSSNTATTRLWPNCEAECNAVSSVPFCYKKRNKVNTTIGNV